MNIRSLLPSVSFGLLIMACASAGGSPGTTDTASEPPPGPSFPSVEGDWAGSITVEGQSIPGTLQVAQEGPDLDGVFRADAIGLVTRGSGSILPDGTVQMTLEYDLQCPGTATMTGELSSDGSRLTGTLVAADCTGDASGSFRFSR